MKCPKCDGKLEPKTFKKVRIDECDNCGGLWFDRDELKRAKDSTDEELAWLDFDIFEEKENKYHKSESSKLCPKDEAHLNKLTYSHSSVSIDACPVCHGIFLEKDEFENIIKFLENEVVENTSADWAQQALSQFGEILNGEDMKSSEFKDLFTVLKLGETRLSAENEKITAVLTFFPIR
jgi:Zn-finger nucleic acid-binding protein